ncbi:MAG: hypothetical protein OSJ76_01845 [Alphaproteobacteria bacterium]|nr:hypothetical protein [Alphaproteobacteria bacterium]
MFGFGKKKKHVRLDKGCDNATIENSYINEFNRLAAKIVDEQNRLKADHWDKEAFEQLDTMVKRMSFLAYRHGFSK